MKNNKILILEGGNNEEHEVSLESSLEIQKILKKLKIEFRKLKVNPKNFENKILNFRNYLCFNALHGSFGEDGQIQRILKKNNIKFTHSGLRSSKVCFDKVATKKIIKKNKILTPRFKVFKKNDLNKKNIQNLQKIYKKFVIKPNKSGSSYGIEIIKNNKDFKIFLNKIENFKKKLTNHDEILIEEFISGKELTVSTIKLFNKIESLAVTQIVTKNNFFDYQAKYTKGYAKHLLPAKLSKNNYNKCLGLAKKIHKILGCNSIARSDFIYNTKNNKIYFLETNTQPGLTSISLLPEQAVFKKISLDNLILGILNNYN